MKDQLRKILEDTDWFLGRVVSTLIQSFIFISILFFCIDTLPDLDPELKLALDRAEFVFACFFAVEYLLRLYVARLFYRYMFSFLGVVDLLAVLPFFLSLSSGFFALRVFRLFRLLRLFKMFRYSTAFERMFKALKMIREELVLYFLVSSIFILLAAIGIYHFEHEAQPKVFASVFHSLWWAVATLTTVGYGDIYPVTIGGKIFTFIILLVGLGLISIPSGLISAAFTNAAREVREERKKKQ